MTRAIPQSAGATERWRRVPWRWRVVMVVLAGAVVIEFALSLAGAVYGTPSRSVLGPASSFDTSGTGTAALAQLLRGERHPVRQLGTRCTAASCAGRARYLSSTRKRACPRSCRLSRASSRRRTRRSGRQAGARHFANSPRPRRPAPVAAGWPRHLAPGRPGTGELCGKHGRLQRGRLLAARPGSRDTSRRRPDPARRPACGLGAHRNPR